MSKRILIVDDEADNLILLVHILRFMLNQEDLVTATDGHEAMRVAYATNPDLILMDLTLPKLTGWEATRSLRVSQQFKETPIVALTAHAMVGDKELALDAGCNDYFPKPIDIDQFIRFIQPYLVEQKVAEPSLVNSAQSGASVEETANKAALLPDQHTTRPETVDTKRESPTTGIVSDNGGTKTANIDATETQAENKPVPAPGKPVTGDGNVDTKQESSTVVSAHDAGGTKTTPIDQTDT